MQQTVNIFWFRRDLRLHDNHGLWQALKSGTPVLPIFIFDTNILASLPKNDARVTFIHREISQLKQKLNEMGTDLKVFHGDPQTIWTEIFKTHPVKAIYANTDYEPYARARDEAVQALATQNKAPFYSFKDQVIFEKNEVVKKDGAPYTVFTPYSRTWKDALTPDHLAPFNSQSLEKAYLKVDPSPMPSLPDLGFTKSDIDFPAKKTEPDVIESYDQTRDTPALAQGTSHLGLHLRFGTISIRQLVQQSLSLNQIFVSELCWRDFYQQILWHFPQVQIQSFKPKYDQIKWRNNKEEFQQWCEGKTGYPLVDAGMRQLNQTGYMHNRVRMVTASFLCKHLLIDWRWGEAYFAEKLLDYDLAANNGGWQWSAGTGCDAAPYFRVFNPTAQQQKFDPDFKYISQWVPEFDTADYPAPMVDHKAARERALTTYKAAL